MTIRALIVDPDIVARELLRKLLAAEPDVTVVAECADGTEATRLIAELAPHVMFLDPKCPGNDGFAVLASLAQEQRPLAVFVTKHHRHAFTAFDHGAVDCLLKPLKAPRLQLTVSRVRERLTNRTDGRPTVGTLARFVVRTQGRLLVVPADQVDWLESANNYIVLHADRDTHVVRDTLNNLELRLPAGRFLRISRFAIINLTRVRSFKLEEDGSHTAVMADGAKVRLTRGIRELQERLETA